MRVVAGSFAALFLLAVAVQWNDPDPLPWMLGYGLAAGLSVATCFGRIPVALNALAAVAFVAWFATLAGSLPGAPSAAFTSFEMQAASHEEPREAVGLLLAAAWTGLQSLVGWRRGRAGGR